MTKIMPMVRQLQAEAIDPGVLVAKLLRLAKVIATKLNQGDALRWIDRELDGYLDLKISELPAYRILEGHPKGYNPYRGWQTIHFTDPEHARDFSKAYMGQSIGAIEQDLTKRKGGHSGQAMFPYAPETREMLRKAIGMTTDVGIFLSDGQIWGIVEAVRNLVLNWSLELEKAGVLGEDMSFTDEEKREAGAVTQQFFIQNAGVVGNVGGNAQVAATQSAPMTFDMAALEQFVNQTRQALALLPSNAREKLELVIEQIDVEARRKKPNASKLTTLLASAKTIAEGTTGNVIASGIVSMIGKLFGGA